MQFDFSGHRPPVTVRILRSLVWTQATFILLAGTFVIFAASVFGTSSAIPFHGDTLSGARAAALGAVYVATGAALVYLGVEVGRLVRWARNATVFAQVFVAVLLIFQSTTVSVATVIDVGLDLAILVVLFVPGTRRAFERAAVAPTEPGADTA